jgi:hypothetical protein
MLTSLRGGIAAVAVFMIWLGLQIATVSVLNAAQRHWRSHAVESSVMLNDLRYAGYQSCFNSGRRDQTVI